MSILIILKRTVVFLVLTVFTQVGGVVYLLTIPLGRWVRQKLSPGRQRAAVRVLVFVVPYLVVTLFVVPLLARPFGRVPLPMTRQHHLQPNNIITCLLNRNYVRPELRAIAMETATTMNRDFPGTEVNYLEASFPFINGFPLWPHLSHNDGKKLDLSFCYLDRSGAPINKTPSFFGYGICEEPRPGEKDQPCSCGEQV
jgi:hypothetical protein